MRGTIAAITTIIAADLKFDRMMPIDQATTPGQWLHTDPPNSVASPNSVA
jgi:hypothetical protein